jgi:oligoendopeptidase F
MSSRPNQTTTEVVWNLAPLFSSDNDPKIETDLAKTQEAVKQFANSWKDRSEYLTDPVVLLEAITQYDSLLKNYGIMGNAGYYFHLRFSQEQNNPDLKARINKIDEMARRLLNDIHFFELRLSRVEPEIQKLFLADKDLAPFQHFLERLFARSRHMLSEAEEKIINLKGGPAHSDWTRMTNSFLAKETRRGKNVPELLSESMSTSKTTRDRAAKDLNSIMDKYAEVAENELNAILGNKKIDDQLRNLPRPDAGRHLDDDIESSVVDAMLEAVSRRFDISGRFYKLKAQVLGVKKLKYHERNVPYGKVSQKFDFAQSADLCKSVFLQLDPELGNMFDGFVKNGQLDVYPRMGKHGGAFCTIDLPIQPTYILLNHTDKLRDVTTLAHEAGHGLQNELMKSLPQALNYGTPLSVAEVASTFMEDFVLQRLLEKATAKQRFTIYMEKLNDDISSIFRQVAAYNFEKELHAVFREKGYVPKEEIGRIFQKHMASYLGDYVELSDGSENFWVYWSHFRSFFYVYSYASGLLISKSLQARVKQDPGFVTSVKQILASGMSDSPSNLFKKHAGLDISDPQFWTKGIEEVELLLDAAEKLWEEVKDK